MGLKKEFIIIVWIILFLFFIGFLNTTKDLITGEVGKVGILYTDLEENEYLLYIKEPQWVGDKLVELIDVTENGDVIVGVDNEIRSVSDKIIVNNGLQIKRSSAIKETGNKKSFAVLEIIDVDQGEKIDCNEDDNGYNIHVEGTCYDDYYEMGVKDFCDGDYLKEYYCQYDEYVGKIHCIKETLKCDNGCNEGKCISDIKAY